MSSESLTHHLDALLFSCEQTIKNQQEIKIKSGKNKVRGTLSLYTKKQINPKNSDFARIILYQPLSLKWKDNFIILDIQNESKICEGTVLNPMPLKFQPKRRKIEFLEKLNKDTETMLLALTELKGANGLTESDIKGFVNLSKGKIEKICKELEEKGRIKILSFFPLFIVSERTIDFYCSRAIKIINKFHRKHPPPTRYYKRKTPRETTD